MVVYISREGEGHELIALSHFCSYGIPHEVSFGGSFSFFLGGFIPTLVTAFNTVGMVPPVGYFPGMILVGYLHRV